MKTVLITGANRGLGLGFTRHYVEAGYRVYATARNPQKCTGFDELRQNAGSRFSSLQLDVASETSIAALSGNLEGVELDLVLNNAGTLSDEAFGAWTAGTFDTAFRTNATGPALIAQALVPLMKDGAKLVNLSSGLASCGLYINPETGLDAYSASKAALNLVTRRLAAKLRERDIIVAAFDPGWVRTRMGGSEAELTVAESIGAVTASIDGLTLEDSGLFLGRTGEQLPW